MYNIVYLLSSVYTLQFLKMTVKNISWLGLCHSFESRVFLFSSMHFYLLHVFLLRSLSFNLALCTCVRTSYVHTCKCLGSKEYQSRHIYTVCFYSHSIRWTDGFYVSFLYWNSHETFIIIYITSCRVSVVYVGMPGNVQFVSLLKIVFHAQANSPAITAGHS